MEGYTIGEFPRSEELYHHGVRDQKWYVRRYQNLDGSLTPLGREHYKVGPPRDTMARRFITYQLNKIAARHPWLLTDEQLAQNTERARKVYTYRKAKNDADDLKRMSAGRKAVGKLFTGTGKVAKATVGGLFKFADNTAGRMFGLAGDILETNIKKMNNARIDAKIEKKYPKDDKKTMSDVSYIDVLTNPSKYTKKDLDIAQALFTGRLAYDKSIREENRLSSRLYREFNSKYDPAEQFGGYSEDEYSSFLRRIEEARIAEGLSKPPKKDNDDKKGREDRKDREDRGSTYSGESKNEGKAREQAESRESSKDYGGYTRNNRDRNSSSFFRQTSGIPEPDNYGSVLRLRDNGYKWPSNKSAADSIFITLPNVGPVPLKSIQMTPYGPPTKSEREIREFLEEYYPQNI